MWMDEVDDRTQIHATQSERYSGREKICRLYEYETGVKNRRPQIHWKSVAFKSKRIACATTKNRTQKKNLRVEGREFFMFMIEAENNAILTRNSNISCSKHWKTWMMEGSSLFHHMMLSFWRCTAVTVAVEAAKHRLHHKTLVQLQMYCFFPHFYVPVTTMCSPFIYKKKGWTACDSLRVQSEG